MLGATATLLTLGSDAGADAIFALQGRVAGLQALTILPGDPAAGDRQTLDIVMIPDTERIGFGLKVALPEGRSLSFVGGGHWEAVEVPDASGWHAGPPMILDEEPLRWIADHGLGPYREGYEYATRMTPPNGFPWSPEGTYVVGSKAVGRSAVFASEMVEPMSSPIWVNSNG